MKKQAHTRETREQRKDLPRPKTRLIISECVLLEEVKGQRLLAKEAQPLSSVWPASLHKL